MIIKGDDSSIGEGWAILAQEDQKQCCGTQVHIAISMQCDAKTLHIDDGPL